MQITGPLTFNLNIQNPDASFPYLFAAVSASILDPQFVIPRDLATWTSPAAKYLLPYPNLDGLSLISKIDYYLKDEAATCDRELTPVGCATTYLDVSAQGSLGGTGPYVIQSTSNGLNDTVLESNANYWGGPYQLPNGNNRIIPHFQTIYIKYVPLQSDRTRDLANAGRTNREVITDIDPQRLYDVANSTTWLGQNKTRVASTER